MLLTTISTGSKGNTYILDAGDESIILDAGVPAKKTLVKLRNYDGLAGVLITHEHQDHAKAWADYLRRGIRIYTSQGTKDALAHSSGDLLAKAIVALQPLKAIRAKHFVIMPFEAEHDAAQPVGFLIRYEPTGETVIYATDTYYLRYTFPNVNYWIVECNYCDELIENTEAGSVLHMRLLQAHMSLRRLKDALRANDLSKTRKIVLVHLSDERSDEARMIREIEELTGIETEAARDASTIRLDLTPF